MSHNNNYLNYLDEWYLARKQNVSIKSVGGRQGLCFLGWNVKPTCLVGYDPKGYL